MRRSCALALDCVDDGECHMIHNCVDFEWLGHRICDAYMSSCNSEFESSNVFCVSLESTQGCIAIESIRQCCRDVKNVDIAAWKDAIHTLTHSMEISGHGRNVG